MAPSSFPGPGAVLVAFPQRRVVARLGAARLRGLGPSLAAQGALQRLLGAAHGGGGVGGVAGAGGSASLGGEPGGRADLWAILGSVPHEFFESKKEIEGVHATCSWGFERFWR